MRLTHTPIYVLALLFQVALMTPALSASPLDDQITAFDDPASVQSEQAVTELLKTAVAERRSAEGLAAVQQWLNRNNIMSPQGLLHVGQATEYAGQWRTAVGYYQRIVQANKPDGRLAGPAVDAAYRLLLGPINDADAAYAFMRKDGDRLRPFGDARKYDRWFLDQARQRDDLLAVTHRLAAIVQDQGTPLDRFTEDFAWLCRQLEKYERQSDEVYEAGQSLAALQRTPAIFRARVNWVCTVMPYNLALDELRNANAPADPRLTDAPLAAAATLIKADPDHALTVCAGWNARYDGGHSANAEHRFNVERQRKVDQLLAAVPRMSVSLRDDLLAYPLGANRTRFDTLRIHQLMVEHPGMANTLTADNIPVFNREVLTVDAAKAIADQLARSPHDAAAQVRAIAASGSLEFGDIANAMVKSERWRFKNIDDLLRTARSASTTTEADFNALKQRHASFEADREAFAARIAQGVDGKPRRDAFETLYRDLLSDAPQTPDALNMWEQLFANAVTDDTVFMAKRLTADLSGDREYLLKRAIPHMVLGKNGKVPWQADAHHNQFRYHRKPVIASAPELIEHLQNLVQQQSKAGTISPTVFGMWLHTIDRNSEAARSFMRELLASPAYAKLPSGYHNAVADSDHFGPGFLRPAVHPSHPHVVSRPLLDLTKEASPAAVTAAFAESIKRAQAAPDRVHLIGLEPVAQLSEWDAATRQRVMSLLITHTPTGPYPTRQGYTALVQRISREVQGGQQATLPSAAIAGLWHAASSWDDGRYLRASEALVDLAEHALESGRTSLALSLARSGLSSRVGQYLASRSERDFPERVARLNRVMGKASIALGIIDIPVDQNDPAYPIYQSQAEFAQGNTDTAWALYTQNADQLDPVLRELTIPYALWLLERNIEQRASDRAEQLIRALTIWSREVQGTFTPQQDAELKIAYADAAFQRGALQTAKAWYRRVADANEHKGTPLQYKAMLRSVHVDRAAKDFASAMSELDRLMMVRDDELRTRVHYARAEVMFDQENYAGAFDEVSIVLRRNPSHPDALILLGQAQLQMRKLVDASEIELGVSQDQKLIVPGQTLKINLNDPALNVSGVGADIEVEVWSKSGDRERVMLYQLGDDKTKFRAEVPIELGAKRPGDKKLQVLGRDEVRYGYSKRFRERMSDLPPDPEVVIRIGSDAHLAASAGAFPPRAGEVTLQLGELGVDSAQESLGRRRVRPGNPVYVRVTDPDQSRTADIDQVVVSVQASSGDTIPRLVLKETGPYTGEFEATIPTAPAQALAYASEAAPGRDANMVISAQDYPGWAGVLGSQEQRVDFTIDLNDNVAPDAMTLRFADPGQRPTRFAVQTSLNGRTWETRAHYPQNEAPWDGRPQITTFPTYGRNATGISAMQDRDVPDDWREKMDVLSASSQIDRKAVNVGRLAELNGKTPMASGGHPGYSVLMRYRAVFYQPFAATRTFKLDGLPMVEKTQTAFLLDGQPASENQDDPLTITRELEPGVHEIEVWRSESRGELLKRKPRILQDVGGSAELEPCPADMFDPKTFPLAAQSSIAAASHFVDADADSDMLLISFGENTRARLIRLAIVEHSGQAPAISKISLTDRSGVSRLPVQTDYQQLRSNDQLEVVPGDQVALRYQDDQAITPRRLIQQDRLSVAFNTAEISASYLNFVIRDGERQLQLEDIRRFKMGDRVGIVIRDADMDQTRQPDELTFTAQSGGGQPVTLTALETGPNTGVFIGRVSPVESAPTRESDIMVEPGGTLTATYLDAENLDPGIPTDRVVTLEHARFAPPQLAVYTVESTALPPGPSDADEPDEDERGPEVVRPRQALSYTYPETSQADLAAKSLIGSSLRFDILAPHLAFARSSEIIAYVQTESGRAAHIAAGEQLSDQAFDVAVPGTLKLTAVPTRNRELTTPPGYVLNGSALPPTNRSPIDEGRFAFEVPVVLGDVAIRSYATQEAEALPASQVPTELAVQPGDRVYIAFAYIAPDGTPQWITSASDVYSHAFMDVMNARYRRTIDTVYVGEKLHVRLIAPELNVSPERDLAAVELSTANGISVPYRMRETQANSGVFKGSFNLRFMDQPIEGDLPPVELHGPPVKYGDIVTITYQHAGPDAPPPHVVSVNRGADGFIEPFSKRFGDDSVAIQTTFTLAECFFELAKYHRKMNEESLARRQMGQAQKLLSEAIASHRDEDMQAHAEYLLGNLAQEYADLSNNDVSRQRMYQDALGRFTKIVLDYGESEFAPKAQFKKGLVYEKLGELDIAVEEYVKLAYKYPQSELIPSVMSRLGSYFQSQGKAHKDRYELLEQDTSNTEAQGEALRLRELATAEYLNAARVFQKLQERFPADPLAGLAGLRSAQNYIRAGDNRAAISGFRVVIDTEEYDDKDIRSQALFWTGIAYERLGERRDAYQTYRRVTFDFPDSVWAKQARGRLADPVFADIVEQERLARERMMEALQEQQK